MNIIDYTVKFGDKTFSELGFGPVDAAVLCQLSYLKLEYVVPRGGCTLLDTMLRPSRDRLFEDSRFGDDQRRMYFEAAFSARYQGMRIRSVSSVRDESYESCFCAMVFEPEGCAPVVVFRGTDEYLVGWKENFVMAYQYPVPSQTLSVAYLEKVMSRRGEFYVCGHSKGGNLARYSAMNASPRIRQKIITVFDLDGPGFAKSVSASVGYKELQGRVHKLVPEKSLVGRLLTDASSGERVESEGVGILQHDLFKWHVGEDGNFVCLNGGSDSYKPIAEHINDKIASLSKTQLESFVEALFGIFKDADIDSLLEIGEDWFKSGKKILGAYMDLDEDTRRVLNETLMAILI